MLRAMSRSIETGSETDSPPGGPFGEAVTMGPTPGSAALAADRNQDSGQTRCQPQAHGRRPPKPRARGTAGAVDCASSNRRDAAQCDLYKSPRFGVPFAKCPNPDLIIHADG